MAFKTLPGLLKHVQKSFKNEAALACKQEGIWLKFSTEEVGDTVKRLCLGLMAMGLRKGERVGIVADPSPYWIMMDLAVLCAGGVTVPMFVNIAPENLEYEIKDSKMRFLFVGTKIQIDAMQPYFRLVEKVIALPPDSQGGQIVAWENLLQSGDVEEKKDPQAFSRVSETLNEQDTATLIYTSGSTGMPKGVELSHRNLVSQVIAAGQRFPLDPITDTAVSCLPLAHVFERMVSYFFFSAGISVFFAEDVKKVGDALREIRPTIITLVPRLLEKVYLRMQSNAEAATGLKKALALKAFERAKTKSISDKLTLKDRIFDLLVYKKLRAALGGNLRLIVSGSAPLDPNLATFFINVGLPIYEGYGLTEAAPVLAVNFPGHRKVGTVGPVFPSVEIKIADDGEILARGPNIMRGYHGKPTETAESIDTQGWLHTGDLGHLDNEGFLKITGRKKELFKTANGKYVAPVPIEQALTTNKLVDMAMVIAEGKPYTTAVLFPDFENINHLKEELGEGQTETLRFLKGERARLFIQHTVDEMNQKLNHWEQVQKWVLVTEPISIDSGALTPTMKLRRHVILDRFSKEIDSLYAA